MRKSMNHFLKNIDKTVVVLALAAFVTPAVAQTDKGLSPAAQELLKEQRLWFQSSNAAGTAFDDTRNYSNLNVNYDVQTGDFHRVMTGKTIRDANIYTEGFLNLKNAYVWGEFKFTHENVRDARFNASITDPYRGQPYFVVDSGQSSKWRNQNYHLRFRAATPLVFGHFTFGIDGTYKAQLAAKQRDPRTDTRFYTLQLMPGATYVLGRHDRVGANLVYASIKEESSMNNNNAYVYQQYYALYGLGTASSGIGSGRTTNYYGNRWGFNAQYGHNDGKWDLLAEFGWNKYVENNEISFTTPRKDGLLEDKTWMAALHVIRHGEAFTHQAKIGFSNRHINGIQYLSQRDNTVENAGWVILHEDVRSKYKTTDYSANYSLIRNRGNEYNWRVDLSGAYQKYDDTFILPASHKNSENIYLSAAVKKNFKLGEELNNRLLFTVQGGWKDAISGEYVYGGSNADYITVTEMEPLDEAYLTADAWNIGTSLTYSQLAKRDTKVNVYAKAAFDYQHTSDFDFNHRAHVSITLGVNF